MQSRICARAARPTGISHSYLFFHPTISSFPNSWTAWTALGFGDDPVSSLTKLLSHPRTLHPAVFTAAWRTQPAPASDPQTSLFLHVPSLYMPLSPDHCCSPSKTTFSRDCSLPGFSHQLLKYPIPFLFLIMSKSKLCAVGALQWYYHAITILIPGAMKQDELLIGMVAPLMPKSICATSGKNILPYNF